MTVDVVNYSLCFATLHREPDLLSFDVSFQEVLLQDWDPEYSAIRYGREWHISEAQITEDGLIMGELGYVLHGELDTLDWDTEAKRFVRGNAPAGSISPFVIDPLSQACCFQLRPGYIRPTSFTEALKDLLNKGERGWWSVTPLVKSQDFEAWAASVERITKFSFKLERPNPNYLGRPQIESMIEGLHAEVNLRGKALPGESIASDAPIFQQALAHVRRRYGRGKVHGELPGGEVSEWHSVGDGVTPAVEKIQAAGEPEASTGVLTSALRRRDPSAYPQTLDADTSSPG